MSVNISKPKAVISQPWGGLGDNLAYSTLPELFHKKGYDVYIHKDNNVRNHEIFDLIWGHNPYIKGITDEPANAGECKNSNWPPETDNEHFLHRIELSHGLERTSDYPKIYYISKTIDELYNVVLIDLTGSSQVYGLEKYIEFIDYFVPLLNNDKSVKIVTFENHTINPIFESVYGYLLSKKENIGYYKINSLMHYCDSLKSCDTVIIINSGINSLVSAVKQNEDRPTVLSYYQFGHFTPEAMNGYYTYKNIEYIKSKA
jgi:hypothetical protein